MDEWWQSEWRKHFEKKRDAWLAAGGEMTIGQALALNAATLRGSTARQLQELAHLTPPRPDNESTHHKSAPQEGKV